MGKRILARIIDNCLIAHDICVLGVPITGGKKVVQTHSTVNHIVLLESACDHEHRQYGFCYSCDRKQKCRINIVLAELKAIRKCLRRKIDERGTSCDSDQYLKVVFTV